MKIRFFNKFFGVFLVVLIGQGTPKVSVVVFFFCFVRWSCVVVARCDVS